MNYLKVKRLIDIVLSILGFLVLLPVFVIIVILIKIDSKGPILFRQKRVGIHKSFFHILKFRTMRVDTPKDTPTHLLANPEQWITRVGKVLRRTSLDELPQIINIFKGDMSIVGPRPALWNQVDLIDLRDKFGVNSVKPGLTGWAQVNGRDELSIEEKVKLDIEYVSNMGYYMDFKCLVRTIYSVIRREGVLEGGIRIKKHEKNN